MINIALDRNENMLPGYLVAMDQWGGLLWIGEIANFQSWPPGTVRLVMHPDDAAKMPRLPQGDAA